MAALKSTATGKSGGGVAQTSDQSADRRARERITIRMVQNALLIWVDSNIDDNDADCRTTLTQLRRVVNTIDTYTNADECLEFLQTVEDEKVCIIISGSLGQNIVPRIHYMAQVDSIFIFCGNKKRHEQWVKE